MSDTTVISGKALRAKLRDTLELPSGGVVEVTRPDIAAVLSEAGDVPEFFSGPLLAGIKGGKKAQKALEKSSPKRELDMETLQDYLRVVNQVVTAALVNPRIVDKPEEEMSDNEIGIQHLSFADRNAIFSWAFEGGEGQTASKFPTK